MKTNIFIILLMSIFLLIGSCSRDYSPLWPLNSSGHGSLEIKTDLIYYPWQVGEYSKYVSINGTLKNNSSRVYYSKLGDLLGGVEQNPLLIFDNSAGFIEKYDENNKSWNQVRILTFLSEGASVVKIDSSKQYSIYAHLVDWYNGTEKGKFRIGIDYYGEQNPNENSVLYQDYSNVFELK